MRLALFIIIALVGFIVGGSIASYVLYGSVAEHSLLTTLGAIGGAILAHKVAEAIEDILKGKR